MVLHEDHLPFMNQLEFTGFATQIIRAQHHLEHGNPDKARDVLEEMEKGLLDHMGFDADRLADLDIEAEFTSEGP